jgi:hypothetical protein
VQAVLVAPLALALFYSLIRKEKLK